MSVEGVVENPYVAVVAKKYRNLKKKVEKVSKLDSDLKSGKALNIDQLQTIKTLGELERSLADIESIKWQLEEVALAFEGAAAPKNPTRATTESGVGTVPKVVCSSSQYTSQVPTANKATSTFTTSTFSTHSNIAVDAASASNTSTDTAGSDAKTQGDTVRKLMEVLHVFANYDTRTSQGVHLPPEVDYFGRHLLGDQ
jgi:hypothetical protein